MEIIGKFWLNEQDPYEPTGIMFEVKNEKFDLADILHKEFGLDINFEGKPHKKLKIRIEEA